ncbi:hypothetical protein GCM10010392_43900 [Streptomyces clavifer]|nr:hypothetical protein GCM10010392_43900 [Streptomyces clavifer]
MLAAMARVSASAPAATFTAGGSAAIATGAVTPMAATAAPATAKQVRVLRTEDTIPPDVNEVDGPSSTSRAERAGNGGEDGGTVTARVPHGHRLIRSLDVEDTCT